mmetsp:Transcript_7186/g.24884  ORF Transcript_7186/g.24884 Transcript_7186/m.24884 type:complete len:207 (-) Transcript_7186:1286-1906(-)
MSAPRKTAPGRISSKERQEMRNVGQEWRRVKSHDSSTQVNEGRSSIHFASRLPSLEEGVFQRKSRTSKGVARPMERSICREEADVRRKEDLSQAKVDLVLDDFRGRTVSDAGRGIVKDFDKRIKPGEKVKIAASFANEDWCQPYVGQVGVLVEPDPATHGTWKVQFGESDELVSCCVGLMGRFHLVYEEDEEQGTDDESDSSGPDL